MGSWCSRSNSGPMPQFQHLRPNTHKDEDAANECALSAQEQQLNAELLQIIDRNFKAGMDEWNHLDSNESKIDKPNGRLPSKITETVFLGDHRAASNASIYDKDGLGIRHVVNCAANEFVKEYPANVSVLRVPADDDKDYDIIQHHIADIVAFLDGKEKDKILFHCLAGVNRSVTLCVAYLLHQRVFNKCTESECTQCITDVMDLVSKQRHIGILSNMSFVKRLVQYNTRLHSEKN